MKRPTWLEIALAALAVVLIFSVWSEHSRAFNAGKLSAQHDTTVVRELVAGKRDTIYRERAAAAQAARVALQPLRDSVRARPADTVRVKEYVSHVDSVLVKDSLALVAADSAIAAQKAVTRSVRAELAEAMKPRPLPRVGYELAGWYDPLTGTPSGSAGVQLRVIGHLALAARVEQRPILERPQVRVGFVFRM